MNPQYIYPYEVSVERFVDNPASRACFYKDKDQHVLPSKLLVYRYKDLDSQCFESKIKSRSLLEKPNEKKTDLHHPMQMVLVPPGENDLTYLVQLLPENVGKVYS